MRILFVAGAAALSLAGCNTTPAATPMEAYLNRYAGAEAVAMNCPAYGGYGSVSQMRADAQANLAKAKALGASDADVAKARQKVSGNLAGATVLVGPIQACSTFMNGLAWAGTEAPKIQPKAPAKKKS
ncbi:hypothetical protein [Ensifer sp.]|uniref:hypothetical protein n=1 Tax=Ensifer sp. TaxID=1872086 RepID=UPI00289EC6FD|nr:hypothetical protein [Ensifer sp.]